MSFKTQIPTFLVDDITGDVGYKNPITGKDIAIIDQVLLPIIGGGGSTVLTPTAFTTAIDLSSSKLLAAYTIAGALTFTTTGTPVAGNIVRLRLTANGTNVPDLSAFREMSNSAGFSNIANVVNIIDFIYDGVDYLTNIRQRVGDMGLVDTVAPTITALTTTSATLVTLTASEPIQNITYLPSSFTLSGIASAPTVSAVTYVDSTHFTLTLSAAIVGSDAPNLTYTQPGSSVNQLKDLAGNLLATFTNTTITNTIGVTASALQLSNHNIGTLTEALVSGGYNYTVANTGAFSYVSGVGIAAGKDGFILMTVGAHTSVGVQLGIANASTVTNFNSSNSSASLVTTSGVGYAAENFFAVRTVTSALNSSTTPSGGITTRNGTVSGTCATGDIIKYERKGSATVPYIECSVSKDSGSTYTVFETLVGTTTANGFVPEGCNVTGAVYAWIQADSSSAGEVTAIAAIVSGVKAYSAP